MYLSEVRLWNFRKYGIIECVFRAITSEEAGPLLEWLGFEEILNRLEYVLTLRLVAHRKAGRIITDLSPRVTFYTSMRLSWFVACRPRCAVRDVQSETGICYT